MVVSPEAEGAPASRIEWDRIVRAHGEQVVAAIMALGLDRERADEVAQLTWSALFEKLSSGRLDHATFPGLALRHARYRALDRLRADAAERRRHAGVDAIDELPAATPLDAAALTDEQIQTVKRALATCSPAAQKLFRIVYTRPDLPHAAVAAQLGLSVQRVRQSLCELRKKLRLALEDPT